MMSDDKASSQIKKGDKGYGELVDEEDADMEFETDDKVKLLELQGDHIDDGTTDILS